MSGGKVKIAAVVVVFAWFAHGAHPGHPGHGLSGVLADVSAQPVSSGASTGDADSNVALGRQMAASGYGWRGAQFACLNWLWTRESGWQTTIWNTQGSGAYGIPQSLPASKMASAGADYMTDPATQIKWGLGYIRGTYGTPCGAWAHEEANDWY